MQVSVAMPSLRAPRATDALAHEIVGRIKRSGLVLLGVLIIIVGIIIAPLPGPGGIPVIVVGLMIVLRNSFKAKRHFVRATKRHPKMLHPIRRLMRREPEFIPVAWQQHLRVERLLLPKRYRFSQKLRHRYRKRAAAAA
jgi:predicted membrane chloride channel (bestrophin family)